MFNWTLKNPLKRYWFILIFARPGNGKSLEQARLTWYLFKEYHDTERKYPGLKKRYVLTNQFLRKDLSEKEIEHGHLQYWDLLKDLRWCKSVNCWIIGEHKLHDCDILVDEGSTLFPADRYGETPRWLCKMWAQHRHRGIRIVMLTQDYSAIDINCRRMLWKAYIMKKRFGSRDITPTLPPLVKWSIWNFLHPRRRTIWGLYTKQQVSPEMLEADNDSLTFLPLQEQKVSMLKKVRMISIPRPHFITAWKCFLYDTTQDIIEVKEEQEYEHQVGRCVDKECNFTHISHKLK